MDFFHKWVWVIIMCGNHGFGRDLPAHSGDSNNNNNAEKSDLPLSVRIGYGSQQNPTRPGEANGKPGSDNQTPGHLGPVSHTDNGHMHGVNLAGAEFGPNNLPGQARINYMFPTTQELDYYKGKGMDLIRVPFLWERMQPGLLNKYSANSNADRSFNPEYEKQMDDFLAQADQRGMKVILDAHDYGRFNNQVIAGQGSNITADDFKQFWGQMSRTFGQHSSVYGYDLSNEPHDEGANTWQAAAQAGIDGIRAAGDKHAVIVEGNQWAGAQSWDTNNNNLLVQDSANNIIYSAHSYWDSDHSGTYVGGGQGSYNRAVADARNQHVLGAGEDPSNLGINNARPFVDWLKRNNVRGYIGEYGVPSNDPEWVKVQDKFLAYARQNNVATTAWGGGPYWGRDYVMTLETGPSGEQSVNGPEPLNLKSVVKDGQDYIQNGVTPTNPNRNTDSAPPANPGHKPDANANTKPDANSNAFRPGNRPLDLSDRVYQSPFQTGDYARRNSEENLFRGGGGLRVLFNVLRKLGLSNEPVPVQPETNPRPANDNPAPAPRPVPPAPPEINPRPANDNPAPAPRPVPPAQPEVIQRHHGVNLCGAEFGEKSIPGRLGKDYIFPTTQELDYYKQKGMDLIRVPFFWERMQPGLLSKNNANASVNRSFDSVYADQMEKFLTAADERGMKVVLDAQQFGRYSQHVIAAPGSSITADDFKQFWGAMATKFGHHSSIYGYDLSNEPHDEDSKTWHAAAQAALDGVRAAGDKHSIIVEGNNWAGSTYWNRDSDDLYVQDPANNVIYSAHSYWDSNHSGAYAGGGSSSYYKAVADARNQHLLGQNEDPSNLGINEVKPFVDWLKKHNARGYVGEYGVPAYSEWTKVQDKFLAYLKANNIDSTAWGGGPWWSGTNDQLHLEWGPKGDLSVTGPEPLNLKSVVADGSGSY